MSTPQSLPPFYSGIEAVIDNYDVFFLDIWGVLHDGIAPYPDTINTLKALKARNKKTLLLSNSPCRTEHISRVKLIPMGITPDLYDLCLTSGDASHNYIKRHLPNKKFYSFWEDEHPSALDDIPHTRVYDVTQADYIYASLLPPQSSLADFQDTMARALARDTLFICGNPDRVANFGNTLSYCVGSLAEWYEQNGGTVIWHGKPYIGVYNQAWDMVKNHDKSRILAIGDSLHTDVAGATNFGCDVLWNLAGIHWEELQHEHAPQTIDPARIEKALQTHARPTGILNGFSF